jgi:hypothetical protein
MALRERAAGERRAPTGIFAPDGGSVHANTESQRATETVGAGLSPALFRPPFPR